MEPKMIAMISNEPGLKGFPGGYSKLEKLEGGMYRVWLTKDQYEKINGHECCLFDDEGDLA